MAFIAKFHKEAIPARQRSGLTCKSLDLSWKLSVASIAVAICLRAPIPTELEAEWCASETVQPVTIESTAQNARISTQLPQGKDTLQIVICDPLGKEYLHLIYGPRGISNYYTMEPDYLHFGYHISSAYDESINIRTPGAFYRVVQEQCGNSSVTVESNTNPRRRISHLQITDSGDIRQ